MTDKDVINKFQRVGTVNGIVTDTITDAVDDAVSDAVKKRLVNELVYMIFNNGLTLKTIKKEFGVGRATAQRDMALLKKWVL